MEYFLTNTVYGLSYGILYALVAAGLAVIYRSSRVLNFAQGDIVTLSGYLLFAGTSVAGMPVWGGALLAIGGAMTLGVVFSLLIVPMLSRKENPIFLLRGVYSEDTVVNIAIGSLGIALAIQALEQMRWGVSPVSVPPILSIDNVHLGGVLIGGDSLLIIVVGALAFTMLGCLLRYTTIGRWMAATFDNPIAAELVGINIRLTYLLSWIVAGFLAGSAATLAVPLVYLSPTSLVSFMFTAFAAVVVGGLDNLTGVVAGGCFFGLLDGYVGAYGSTQLEPIMVFVVMIFVLMLKPSGMIGRRRQVARV